MEVWTTRVGFLKIKNCYVSVLVAYIYRFVAAAVPKDWPYKKLFDTKLLRLLESGTLDSIRHHWENDIPDCKTLEDDEDSLALGPGEQRSSALKE